VARRRGKITVGGFDEAFTETIAQAWLLIRTYPLDRRPARVASNLVRDTEYHAFVRPTRYRRFTVQLCDSNELSEFPAEASNDDMADALQDLLHGPVRERLSQRSVELLDELSAGTTVEEIAVRRGVRVRTVRTWRRAAINELRGRMRSAA
jgi:DNA-binding CsgD family transcriptional regulator